MQNERDLFLYYNEVRCDIFYNFVLTDKGWAAISRAHKVEIPHLPYYRNFS